MRACRTELECDSLVYGSIPAGTWFQVQRCGMELIASLASSGQFNALSHDAIQNRDRCGATDLYVGREELRRSGCVNKLG
jgi:hypothetical protein